MFSQNNGADFTGKMTSGETSPNSTAMAAHDGGLFIAWKGDSNDNLNVAPVSLLGFTEAAYINQTNIANFPVNPGDTMSCAVSYIGNTAGVINFANQTTGQKFSVTLAPPFGATFSGETVEWIMEAPDRDSELVAAEVHHPQLRRCVRLQHGRRADGSSCRTATQSNIHQRDEDADLHGGGRRCGDHQLHRLKAARSQMFNSLRLAGLPDQAMSSPRPATSFRTARKPDVHV